jgi:16S rRNA (guanine1207-N2)-methyltransferase
VAAVPTPRESFKFNRFEAKAWGKVIEVCSLPGVFSHGRLDAGSSFFLETLSTLNLEFDSALDWGCGAGAVGCLLKKFRSSASVVLADVSAPALESARETVRVNQLSGIQVVPSDGFSHLKGAQFDLIVSNPPAHKGFDSDFGATLNFLSTARNFMTPGGRLLLVANIQLPYLKVMKGNFKKTERLAVNRQFQILAGNN